VERVAVVFVGLSSADAVGLPDDWAVHCLPPDLGQSEVWSVEERLSLDRMKLSRIATRDDDDTRLTEASDAFSPRRGAAVVPQIIRNRIKR
jgi:hypothetical protein